MSHINTPSVKEQTLALYAELPQDKNLRQKRTDIRDKIIELNYSFFGYVATHTYINNTSVTYEDKFQSALLHFCECWWWYKWKGDETHKGYRQDLSFAVFFKPRVGEMIERELNEVKYSIRRSLCMEAGKQLNKHWAQVRYDDLSNVNMSPEKLNSLKAIFGTVYWADLETQAMFIEAPASRPTEFEDFTAKYNSIEDLLIDEMIHSESKLSDKMLTNMSDMYGINFWELKEALPEAEKKLYKKLHDNLDLFGD